MRQGRGAGVSGGIKVPPMMGGQAGPRITWEYVHNELLYRHEMTSAYVSSKPNHLW